jgi:hypothetical protein
VNFGVSGLTKPFRMNVCRRGSRVSAAPFVKVSRSTQILSISISSGVRSHADNVNLSRKGVDSKHRTISIESGMLNVSDMSVMLHLVRYKNDSMAVCVAPWIV